MAALRALECLVALVDTGSVTGAAGALRMSQPALSHQIAGLEKELGTAVVHRLGRGVRVAAAGQAAADEARIAPCEPPTRRCASADGSARVTAAGCGSPARRR